MEEEGNRGGSEVGRGRGERRRRSKGEKRDF